MRSVSPETKTRILDILSEHEEPLRFWDIANRLGYSESHTRLALAWLVAEQSVECLKPRAMALNRRTCRTSTGFDERTARASFLYRLPEPGREGMSSEP